jgi:hypothetical protein
MKPGGTLVETYGWMAIPVANDSLRARHEPAPGVFFYLR